MKNLSKTLIFSSLLSLSTAIDILTPDRPLFNNETLISANDYFVLGFFTPSSTSRNRYVGIWYNKISIQTVVWVANRNNPIVNDTTASLSITPNGTLVVTANNFAVIWSSATATTDTVSNPVAQILDTGNFVVKDANKKSLEFYAWQSFDYPSDTLLPGMKLGLNLKNGLNRNLTAWTSQTDPATGQYTMAMDITGDPQLFLWSSSAPMWRSGPWVGVRFSGIPEMKTYSMFAFNFVQNSDEVYYQFHLKDPTIISQLVVNQTGSTQRLVWLDQSKSWNLFWFAPKDQCDSVSPCGPFGICDPNESPRCECVQGFVPRHPANWVLRDGSDGCIRKTRLDCRNGTDGFVMIREAKLPDTSSSSVDTSLSLDQCKAKCLMNCSCTAYASADINGTGCLIWTTNLTDIRVWSFGGQDLYVRLAVTDIGSVTLNKSNNSRIKTVAIIIPIILSIILLVCIRYYLLRKEKRSKRLAAAFAAITSSTSYNYGGAESKDLDLPLFGLNIILAATNHFSIENKLGEGGFGPVFKGILEDGQEIAVKRLAKTSVQGNDEFKNEMMLIAKLQHRNLVRLLGCCIQGDERMLIYEYMPNKSLDVFLFDKAKCTLLDWQTRYKIIMGIARGLLYLHQDSRFRIIHRDLKASNILLDKEMTPKISDFGMARIFGGDDSEVNTRKVVGTFGYMSPEYAMDGIFSVKSDIFSFGVLVLEIITGKKNRGFYLTKPDMNLLAYAWSFWREGRTLEIVDELIGYLMPMSEALRCVRVGLLCVQERPEDRPVMSSVVLMLGNESVSSPQPKPPGFVASRGPFEHDSSTSKQASSTVNEMSVTMLEGQ